MKEIELKEQIEKWIEEGDWGHCYVCYERYKRVRLTGYYCNQCHGWFCSEHGSFEGKKVPYCIMHDDTLKDIAEENLKQINNNE